MNAYKAKTETFFSLYIFPIPQMLDKYETLSKVLLTKSISEWILVIHANLAKKKILSYLASGGEGRPLKGFGYT